MQNAKFFAVKKMRKKRVFGKVEIGTPAKCAGNISWEKEIPTKIRLSNKCIIRSFFRKFSRQNAVKKRRCGQTPQKSDFLVFRKFWGCRKNTKNGGVQKPGFRAKKKIRVGPASSRNFLGIQSLTPFFPPLGCR